MRKFYSVYFLFLFLGFALSVTAQTPGEKLKPVEATYSTTADIMALQARTPFRARPEKEELEYPDRSRLLQNPNAPAVSSYPDNNAVSQRPTGMLIAQTPSTSFTSATLAETGSFPPDNMGAIGPSQFITFVNGRIKSHNKNTGAADGVLNVAPDVFFSSVMTPVAGSVVLTFTSDPRIRYDRATGRWFLLIIDVPCTNGTCTTTAPNRVLIAVSDAASSAAITNTTVWTFYFFQADVTEFADYPTLGIDANALYIGTNMFSTAGSFTQTNGYVVPKAPLLTGGPITTWKFSGLAVGAGAGPFTPQGVDNFDVSATQGYFIGVDNAVFSTLQLRRVTNPGSTIVSPTISANISLTVPTTTSANPVTHSGNTGGNNGRLDALDDRLYAAMIRNGRLWTAHNFRVSNTGVANTGAQARNAVRWYEIQNLGTTPALVQSGTIYDNAATLAAARQYWIPTVMVSGQGHAAFSLSSAGTAFFINTATTGRLSTDALGATDNSPSNALTSTSNNTSFTYNPASDPGGGSGRRWGDYSYISLDPLDDMTMWMVNQFCNANNSYAARVTKLLAPPPVTPATCTPSSVTAGQASVNITVTGVSASGSGFYDPGSNLPAPARPFNHIAASISGSVTVNSITYVNPTTVTINISTVGSPLGLKNITITNPDGQSATGTAILSINGALPLTLVNFSGSKEGSTNVLRWRTASEENVNGFYVERSTDSRKWETIGFEKTKSAGGNSAAELNYTFTDVSPTGAVQYYRLRMEDNDGKNKLSNVVRLRGVRPALLSIESVYPNPAKDLLDVIIAAPVREQITLRITDMSGRQLLQKTVIVETGTNTIDFNITNLSKGTYFVKLICNGDCEGTVKRFVKQ